MFLSKYLQIFQEFHLGTFLTNSLELIIFLKMTFVNPAQVMTQSTLKQTRVINVLTCGSYNKPWFCLRSTCLSGYFFSSFFFCLVVISIFTLYQQLHVCVMADRFEQVRKAH